MKVDRSSDDVHVALLAHGDPIQWSILRSQFGFTVKVKYINIVSIGKVKTSKCDNRCVLVICDHLEMVVQTHKVVEGTFYLQKKLNQHNKLKKR